MNRVKVNRVMTVETVKSSSIPLFVGEVNELDYCSGIVVQLLFMLDRYYSRVFEYPLFSGVEIGFSPLVTADFCLKIWTKTVPKIRKLGFPVKSSGYVTP